MEAKEEEPSGIQVFLRIRPSGNSSSYIKQDDVDINKVSFHIPKQEDEVVNNSRSAYSFEFNSVLDQKAKQKEVFKTIGVPVIKNALAGYNSTIFAVSRLTFSWPTIDHYILLNLPPHHCVSTVKRVQARRLQSLEVQNDTRIEE